MRLAIGKKGLAVLAVVGVAAAAAAGVGVARDHPQDVAVPQVDTAVVALDSPEGNPGEAAESTGGEGRTGSEGSAGGPGGSGKVASAGAAVGNAGGGGAMGDVRDGASSGSVRAASAPEEIVVSVQGLVQHSGLFHLDAGARVADALTAAGGPMDGADLLSLNLAQRLGDGDQVLVGVAPADGEAPRLGSATISATGGAAGSGAGTETGGASSREAPVNLNTATRQELESLPGVGPVTAGAILDWRSRNGRFQAVDQLTEVKGIGPATLDDLRDSVTV